MFSINVYSRDAYRRLFGVKGQVELRDYHTVGFTSVEDSQQDYTLLASSQDDTGTMLKFSRPLAAVDQNDRAIQAGTTSVIWAYSPSDSILYHGSTRGTKQLELISTDVPVGK